MIDNSAWRDQIPRGWWSIYDQLLADLTRLDPVVEVEQAKEKFGELRVYLAKSTADMDAPIDAASRQSRQTCQECSAPGLLMATKDGFYATVCNEHAQPEGFKPVSASPIIASFRVTGDGKVQEIDR